jgi:hypothetical protein
MRKNRECVYNMSFKALRRSDYRVMFMLCLEESQVMLRVMELRSNALWIRESASKLCTVK